MAFHPYLAVGGNCREAFTRYQEIFGGGFVVLSMGDIPADAGGPPEGADLDAVMPAALTVGDELLMGADDPMGGFDGNVNGMCVNRSMPDVAEAERVFAALAEGGEVQMSLGETFFSPAFGMCRDRFGIPWMINADMPEPA